LLSVTLGVRCVEEAVLFLVSPGRRLLGSAATHPGDSGVARAHRPRTAPWSAPSFTASVSARLHGREQRHALSAGPTGAVAPGVLAATPSLPAPDGGHVGSDWRDVVPLVVGRVAIVIGDVMPRPRRAGPEDESGRGVLRISSLPSTVVMGPNTTDRPVPRGNRPVGRREGQYQPVDWLCAQAPHGVP
jgi:hypothetical protein